MENLFCVEIEASDEADAIAIKKRIEILFHTLDEQDYIGKTINIKKVV